MDLKQLRPLETAIRIVQSPDPKAQGRCLDLGLSSWTIGREAEGEAYVDDGFLSRRHVYFAQAGRGQVTVEDLDSSNGTYVNGSRVLGAVTVGEGAVVRAGSTLMVVDIDVEPESLPAGAGADPHEATEIVGISFATRRLRRAVATVAPTLDPVLILGESGSGKEVAARAIHRLSERPGPFIAVNCAAIPMELAEAELFGCRKGAFTGAEHDRLGYFQQSSGGTLFLDEVGELTAPLQAKLLRALEVRAVQPLGGGGLVPVDLRIVAATNRDLATSGFRGDLLARLEDWVLHIPPLRKRRADILPLWTYFAGDALEGRTLTPQFTETLLLHEWALNARELRKVAKQMPRIHESSSEWSARHLPRPLRTHTASAGEVNRAPDRAALTSALIAAGGNVSKLAAERGWHRRQVYRWLERFEIDAEQFRVLPPSE